MNVPSGQKEAEKAFSFFEGRERSVRSVDDARRRGGHGSRRGGPNSFEEAGRLALGYLKKTR